MLEKDDNGRENGGTYGRDELKECGKWGEFFYYLAVLLDGSHSAGRFGLEGGARGGVQQEALYKLIAPHCPERIPPTCNVQEKYRLR